MMSQQIENTEDFIENEYINKEKGENRYEDDDMEDKCPQCEKDFPDMFDLIEHCHIVHKLKIEIDEDNGLISMREVCEYCDETFSDLTALTEHCNEAHKSETHCNVFPEKNSETCDNICSDDNHNLENQITCTKCDNLFPNILDLNDHSKLVHENIYKMKSDQDTGEECQDCDNPFPDTIHLNGIGKQVHEISNHVSTENKIGDREIKMNFNEFSDEEIFKNINSFEHSVYSYTAEIELNNSKIDSSKNTAMDAMENNNSIDIEIGEAENLVHNLFVEIEKDINKNDDISNNAKLSECQPDKQSEYMLNDLIDDIYKDINKYKDTQLSDIEIETMKKSENSIVPNDSTKIFQSGEIGSKQEIPRNVNKEKNIIDHSFLSIDIVHEFLKISPNNIIQDYNKEIDQQSEYIINNLVEQICQDLDDSKVCTGKFTEIDKQSEDILKNLFKEIYEDLKLNKTSNEELQIGDQSLLNLDKAYDLNTLDHEGNYTLEMLEQVKEIPNNVHNIGQFINEKFKFPEVSEISTSNKVIENSLIVDKSEEKINAPKIEIVSSTNTNRNENAEEGSKKLDDKNLRKRKTLKRKKQTNYGKIKKVSNLKQETKKYRQYWKENIIKSVTDSSNTSFTIQRNSSPIWKAVKNKYVTTKSNIADNSDNDNNNLLKDAQISDNSNEDWVVSGGSTIIENGLIITNNQTVDETNLDDMYFEQDNNVTISNKNNAIDSSEIIQCQFCDDYFSMVGHLIDHLRTHLMDISTRKVHLKCTAQDCGYQPPIFKEDGKKRIHKTTQLLIMEDQFRSKHFREPEQQCPECKKRFFSGKALAYHLKQHKEASKQLCNGCDHFIKIKHLKEHIAKNYSKSRKFVCKKCTKRFKDGNQLEAHEKIHTKDRPYKCNHCFKSFVQKGNCQTHIMRKHPFGKSVLDKVHRSKDEVKNKICTSSKETIHKKVEGRMSDTSNLIKQKKYSNQRKLSHDKKSSDFENDKNKRGLTIDSKPCIDELKDSKKDKFNRGGVRMTKHSSLNKTKTRQEWKSFLIKLDRLANS